MTWPAKKIGEVCTVLSGFGFPKDLQGRTSGDFPFFKVSDMNSRGNEDEMKIANHWIMKADVKRKGYKIAPTGTIIFPKIGGAISTNKKRKLIRGSIYDNNVMGLIPNDKILPDFLFWWLKGFDITEWASDSALPSMKKTTIEETEIPLPPIGEQRKIVEKIEKLFAKIDEASRLRAESSTASAAILPSALHQVFSRSEKEGWDLKKVGEICEKPQYGYTASAKQEKVGPRLLRITDIQGGQVDWTSVPYCKCDNAEKYELRSGDIVFARTGATVGKSFLIESVPEKSVFASYLIRLRAKVAVLPGYLYAFFQSLDYWQQVAGHQVGAAQPNVNASKLSEIKIPLPPIVEQKKIVAYLDALSQKSRELQNLQSQTAADFSALRQSILHNAFHQ